MTKTKRRNIKKRNTRRKKSKMSLKTRTKYTNNKRKYKNTNRKTSNRRTQRGGGLFFVGINDKTGKHIYYSDELEEIIEITRGVKQGGILSPQLFNFFIDELIKKLRSLGIGCKIKDENVP